MPLPESVAQHVDKLLVAFCDSRVPSHVRDKLRLVTKSRGSAVTLYETRPVWNDPSAKWTELPVARFDFDSGSGTWSLKCRDRNERWFRYEGIAPSKCFEDFLDEVGRDPTGIFWG